MLMYEASTCTRRSNNKTKREVYIPKRNEPRISYIKLVYKFQWKISPLESNSIGFFGSQVNLRTWCIQNYFLKFFLCRCDVNMSLYNSIFDRCSHLYAASLNILPQWAASLAKNPDEGRPSLFVFTLSFISPMYSEWFVHIHLTAL